MITSELTAEATGLNKNNDQKKRIAIQGIRSSWHHVAAKQFFGNNISIVPCDTFRELALKLKNNEADLAIMAIENTIAGSILPNYALLQEFKFSVIGEWYVRIQMHLMGVPGVLINEITTVESHPMAILQCSDFLSALNVKVVEKDDTAKSAMLIKENNLKQHAAIAGIAAAEEFGLEILQKNIETNKQNYTRFLILSNEKAIVSNADKASLSFHLKHKVGSLAEVLQLFVRHNLNLTKIQSIPIVGKPYEYIFHVDLEFSEMNNYENAIEKLNEQVSGLMVFGVYKKTGNEIIEIENKN